LGAPFIPRFVRNEWDSKTLFEGQTNKNLTTYKPIHHPLRIISPHSGTIISGNILRELLYRYPHLHNPLRWNILRMNALKLIQKTPPNLPNSFAENILHATCLL
jgi:hypothetical protein